MSNKQIKVGAYTLILEDGESPWIERGVFGGSVYTVLNTGYLEDQDNWASGKTHDVPDPVLKKIEEIVFAED